MGDVAAHDANETIHLRWHYPAHDARADDPHYAAFRAAEQRAKAAGLWKCAVCGSTTDVQGHHSLVEFSLINGVDVGRFNALYGLHLSDADFQTYIEGPGNLEPLCRTHHLGTEGVHFLPEPAWNALRVWRPDLPAPATVEHNPEAA